MIETRFSKRKKLSNDQLHKNEIKSKHRVANDDRISDLPDAIIHQILSLLPIKFVAQTSVLSKRWRHIWLSFADLDFTTLNTVVKTYTRSRNTQSSSEQSDFICDILSLRNKQSSDIRKLRLSTYLSLTRLNKLIRLALRRNVQELDIDVATDDHFTLPRSITRTGSLKVLRLKSRHRGFRLPPQSIMASGFRSLDTLVISLVHFREEPTLHNLFTKSSFPFLRKLSLDACIGLTSVEFQSQALQDLSLQHCFQLNQLDIGCPKLENLRITSCFDMYCSKSRARVCAPRLKVLIWECNALIDICDLKELKFLNEASIGFFKVLQGIGVERLFGVSNLMSGLCHTRSLTLKSQCIEILSKNYLGVCLRDQFVHLKFLEVHTAFNSNNLVGLACLFKISPSLHTLVIRITNDLKNERRQWDRDFWDVPSTDGERHWESQAVGLKSFLNKLTVVRIYGFSEFEDEISLVKFLLKHGTALQELIICSGHCDGKDSLRRDKIKSQMKGFSWASSNAKVEFQ